MSLKKTLASYFSFSRKDRIGVLALIFLILVIIIIPHLFSRPVDAVFLKTDSTLLKALTFQSGQNIYYNKIQENEVAQNPDPFGTTQKDGFNQNTSLFSFDPNTLDFDGWKKLGLNDKTIHTINNYRQKGGKFYKPEDLKKIWGLPKGFYERAERYIYIGLNTKPSFANHPYKKIEVKKSISININTADTAAFISLQGIGSKLASRIVNFREKLGGFYSVNQIGETYGLPDSTFQKIKMYLHSDENGLRKINLNTATKDQLKVHPYIRWNLANVIVEYRNQHGSFRSVEDLRSIALVDEATFEKIAPYISL